jgi:quaternary ammonium compound-resistance protein SugE
MNPNQAHAPAAWACSLVEHSSFFRSKQMPWVYVVIAGLLEIAWALGLKWSDGFSKPLPSVVTVVLMILSFVVLSQGVKSLPIGTAYAVWTGIGAAGTAVFGMIVFREPASAVRLACVGLIVLGIVGLKLTVESKVG